MSALKHIVCGLSFVAMLGGSAWAQARAFVVRAGEQVSAPATGPTSLIMAPGESVAIEAWLAGTAPGLLGAYQGALRSAGAAEPGAAGTVRYVVGSVLIDDAREDWVFFGFDGAVSYATETGLPAEFEFLALLPLNEGAVVDLAYLGEFELVASDDAAGTFKLQWVLAHGVSWGTFFVDETGIGPIQVTLQPLEITIQSGCADTTPPEIVHAAGLPGQTRPLSGYIEPRWHAQFGANAPPVDRVTLVFSEPVFDVDGGPLTAANFGVTQTGGGSPPGVAHIMTGDNITVSVVLDRPVTLQEWTTVIADVADAGGCNQIVSEGNLGPVDEPDRVDIGFLPGDIDQNRIVQPLDLLRFRQYITFEQPGAGTCTACPHHTIGGLPGDYFGVDRDGDVDPVDLVRYRMLIYGAGAIMPWRGETIGPRP